MRNWAEDILVQGGLGADARVERVVSTPYSEVDKVTSGNAVYFLKKTPPGLFLEAAILRWIDGCDPSLAVPKVVAADANQHCFLLASCGEETLRSYFAGHARLDVLRAPLLAYTEIQKASQASAPALLAMGVSDWRLAQLPALYHAFVSADADLERWGIEPEDRRKLRAFQPHFAARCEDVASLGLPDVLNHSDFQENNIVRDAATGTCTIIDWGEVSVSHALWPIIGFFKKIAWRYKIDPQDAGYRGLMAGALAVWGVRAQDAEGVFHRLSMIDSFCYALSLRELEIQTGHFSADWAARIKMALTSLMGPD